jgi:hypothetical protein
MDHADATVTNVNTTIDQLRDPINRTWHNFGPPWSKQRAWWGASRVWCDAMTIIFGSRSRTYEPYQKTLPSSRIM